MTTLERAEEWLSTDPDPACRDELAALIASARDGDTDASRELAERFSGPLEFGTAGLRGLIGAGETRMNLAVIRRTTHGLGTYLLAHPEADVKRRGIVIGYDGRRMSHAFAEATAAVLAALEIPAILSPTLCPTPVCAYATRALDAAAGVMVTASHNPPDYNGYKVYWGNGAQIIPPHDKGIASAIAAAPSPDRVELASLDEARARGLVRDLPEHVEADYLDALQRLSIRSDGDRTAAIAYTPLHGVGDRLVHATLERAGFTNVTSVPEQAEPDGNFPTVAFPNPEEKGALDLAFALADRIGAELVIASDPDVDRLAIAVKKPDGEGFVQLTGNQVGVLLGHYVLTERHVPSEGRDDRLVIASCVSSPQLGAIARALGASYAETLTGFKWIANRALELERTEALRFVFGYEEALGYTVGQLVRDKDGIGSALIFAEMWAARRAEGLTIHDELERIARRFGHYASRQRSITLEGQDGLAKIRAIMAHLRTTEVRRIGSLEVVATSDLKAGTRRDAAGAETSTGLPSSDVLVYELEGGHRIIARPSGTEPKLKIYFDVRAAVASDESLAAADARAQALLGELGAAFGKVAGLDP
jgi:phosphomannomutase